MLAKLNRKTDLLQRRRNQYWLVVFSVFQPHTIRYGIISLETQQCYVVCQDIPYYRAAQEAKNYQEQFVTEGVFPFTPF